MTSPLLDLPGVIVTVGSSVPSPTPPTDTGVGFAMGLALAGPIDHAVLIHSMDEFVATFGARDAATYLYDACDTAFKSGSAKIYVARDCGATPVNDAITLKDSGNATSMILSSIGPTDTGWTVNVSVGTGGAGTFIITVLDATGKLVTVSPTCTSLADALAWGQTNGKVTIGSLGANVPAVITGAVMLGGTDDRTHLAVDTASKQTKLLALFPPSLGPGQLAYPGSTIETVHVALANAASLTNRVALLDMPDTNSATSLVSLRNTFLADANLLSLAETFVAHCADWQIVPGLTSTTKRVVPPSGFWLGLIAASDAATGNPNIAAAGTNGELTYSLGRTQVEWVDADRNSLNIAHINVTRNIYGIVRVYGFRSGANPASDASNAWLMFSNVRLRMRIVNDCSILGESYVFKQIDGRGKLYATFHAAVVGQMMTYYAMDALYGDTAADAFTVVTASPVNTAATAAAQQLNVKIGAVFSPFAEKVFFGITKMPIAVGS